MDKYRELHGTDKVVTESKSQRRARKTKARAAMKARTSGGP